MFDKKFISPEYDRTWISEFVDKSILEKINLYFKEIQNALKSNNENGGLKVDPEGNNTSQEIIKTFGEKCY